MAFLRDDQGRLIRKDGSLVPRPVTRRGPGGPRASCLKVDMLLGSHGPVRDEYEKLMDTPGVFLKDLHKFLTDRGHKINIAAIKNHRARYRDRFKSVREAGQVAEAFCRIRQNFGNGAVLDASQGRFEMRLMEAIFEMKSDKTLLPGEWESWAKAIGQTAGARRNVDKMKEDYERRAKEAVELAAKSGKTAKDVVARMQEILGV